MKKTLKIFIPILVLAAIAVGAGFFFFGGGRTPETGKILIANNGTFLFIDKNNSPIRLLTKNDDAFGGIENGDRVFILHGPVMESYPAQTNLFSILRLGASDEEINEDLIQTLTDLGWIGEEKTEETVKNLCTAGYGHFPAETEKTVSDPVYATCGNTQCKLTYDGVRYSFMYDESVTLYNILLNLVYDEPACACETEFSVTPEFSETYEINLSKYFVRSREGQCSLTKAQAEKIRQAVENVIHDKIQSPVMVDDSFSALYGDGFDAGTVSDAAGKFSLNLFKKAVETADGKNILLSPLSLYTALSLTANAAEGKTLRQFEELLGVENLEGLSKFLNDYVSSLSSGDGFTLANAIWANDDKMELNGDFVKTAKAYFGAEINASPFTEKTLKDINGWVKENTDEMIDGVLNDLAPETLTVIVNALAFRSDWLTEYSGENLGDGYFTAADLRKEDVTYMYGREQEYIEVPGGKGFVKYYKNPRFKFVSLLPDEGLTPEDVIAPLSDSVFLDSIQNPTYCTVVTSMPRFGFDYENECSDALKALGIPDAFDPEKADLGKLGTAKTGGNICMEKVVHKTRIDVTPKGTSAAAVTAELLTGASMPTETKEVFLTRPFLFMIVDSELNLPVFMGVLNSVNE